MTLGDLTENQFPVAQFDDLLMIVDWKYKLLGLFIKTDGEYKLMHEFKVPDYSLIEKFKRGEPQPLRDYAVKILEMVIADDE